MCSICGCYTCPSSCPSAEQESVGTCKICGEDICVGEEMVEIDDMQCHYDCLTLHDLLELLDIPIREAGDDL